LASCRTDQAAGKSFPEITIVMIKGVTQNPGKQEQQESFAPTIFVLSK
jgi:hypothetical protein